MNFDEARKCLIEAAKKHPLFSNIEKTGGKIVIGKGQIEKPQFLFIGEAPGHSENIAGLPFVGRSGELLNRWISETNIDSYAVINAVPIIPLSEDRKIRAPTDEEIAYFRSYVKDLIAAVNPRYIIIVGKTAARCLETSFKLADWNANVGFIYHPAYYLRNGSDGLEDFKTLIKKMPKLKPEQPALSPNVANVFLDVVEYECNARSTKDIMEDFFAKIGAVSDTHSTFMLNNEKWLIDFHPFDHSDDIIVEDKIVNNYDKFLLVKTGSSRIRIPGWTSREKLASTPARDIYRNGKQYRVVFDTNLSKMTCFKLQAQKKLKLLSDYTINQQQAENYGHAEMTGGILAGLRHFVRQAKMPFRDINQSDECEIDGKKVKIFTRDALSDEDILIPEDYYAAHTDISFYVCCKIKGGKYSYLGYVSKDEIEKTRVVQMIGHDSGGKGGERIRRIFAEQYKPMSDIIPIYIAQTDEQSEQIIPQSYVPLHLHTEYSVGDGFGKISYIAETLYKKGFKGAAITDHGTLAGTWEFQKALLSKNLSPIIGCEYYMTFEESGERYHIVVLAKNKEGWNNLLQLQGISVRDNFYYKPLITLENLIQHKNGVIVLSGCSSSRVNKLIEAGNVDQAEFFLLLLKKEFGNDFYTEMQPHNITTNQEVLQKLYLLSQKHSIKSVFTTDVHYPIASDKTYHEAIKSIERKKDYGEAGYGDDCFYLMQESDITKKLNLSAAWMLPIYPELAKNTNEILEKCNFRIEPPSEQDTLPKIDFGDTRRADMLKLLCVKGLLENTPYKYEGAIKDRLDMEIDRILQKGYENYFLIVNDLISFAKKSGIRCGPGRGSVGASLAAYALNITECDPLKHDLLFDRFISTIRRDAPDIDMDFMDVRRDEIYQYLRNKYGEKHCAKIVTYSRFHPKGVLRDVGRIFRIPIAEIEKVCSMVIERSGGDARASFSLTDTFQEFADAKVFVDRHPVAAQVAMNLEGHIRHVGVHAAAIVVAERDVINYIPIRKVGDEITTEWEKQLIEDMKLVKFDVLALKTLSIIDECVKTANCKLPTEFNDVEVYKNVFHTGNTLGIFQFGMPGMTNFAKTLQISTFNDLYDATTLFRPGALHSGQSAVYANRKLGKEPVTYMHPTLEKITKDTRGIILYQEQVMQVMNQTGGMSWAAAETVRKIITKSKGSDAFIKMRSEFVQNTFKLHGMPNNEAERLFDVVSTFGSYSFNKAHAVEYSIITYITAWLKTYYPKHFYAANLKYEDDATQIQEYMQEANKHDIYIEYPEINKSDLEYRLVDGNIYAGLHAIVGVGEKVCKKIIANRPYSSYDDFKARAKVSKSVLKGLIIGDAFRSFGINKRREYEDNADATEFTEHEWAQLIYAHTALKPRIDVLKAYDFGAYNFVDIAKLGETHGNTQQFIRGIVTQKVNKDKLLRFHGVDEHVHKFERRLLYLNINDGTGNIAALVLPATYERYQTILQDIEKQPVTIFGTISRDAKKITVDMLQTVKNNNGALDIDNVFKSNKMLKANEALLVSAQPAVSKKKKSYYKITLDNGIRGLCFQFDEKLFPGMHVKYSYQEPFIKCSKVK